LGSSSDTPFLIAAGALLLLSALASATSAALAALGEHRAEAIFEDKEQKAYAGLQRLVERPDSVRFALLALDSMAKMGFGVLLSILALRLAGDSPAAALVLVGGILVLLVFQTLVRALAVRDPVASLSWAAPVAGGVDLTLRPLIAPLSWISRLLRGPSLQSSDDTTEQLEYLIEKGAEAGYLDDDKRDLLESVIEFSHVRVREIMVPRPKVVALPSTASYEEVVRVVVESGHSRVPVFEDSIDNVVGVLYARKLLEGLSAGAATEAGQFRLQSHLAPPFFVPETMKISHLLTEFQLRSLQIAVVVDEFGGTAGVVTLEDVVEEIVGEIRDEDDDEDEPIRTVEAGIFVADGGVSIRDTEEFLEEALPDEVEFEFPEDGDYDTVGGFVTAMAGRVPQDGEEVHYGGMIFKVLAADEKRVLQVELRQEEEPMDEAAPESAQEGVEGPPVPLDGGARGDPLPDDRVEALAGTSSTEARRT